MSISAIFGTRLVVPPPSAIATKSISPPQRLMVGSGSVAGGLLIECSSRPQKKATKHHMKTRPRKRRLSDIRRTPTVYPPLSMPSEWSFVSDETAAEAPPRPEPEPVPVESE